MEREYGFECWNCRLPLGLDYTLYVVYNINKGMILMKNFINIPTIGQILQKEFLEPLNISQNALANAINVPSNRINAIVRGQRNITADTDLRLTKFFGLSKGYFLRLQNGFELIEQERKIETDLDKIIPFDYEKKAV